MRPDQRGSGPRVRGSLRKHATTIVLVALTLATALLMRFLDRDAVTTDEAEHRKRNLLEAWRADEIVELEVTASGRTARLLRAEADDAGRRMWRVTIEGPANAESRPTSIDGTEHAADEQAVDQYLGTLEFATAERRVSAEATDRAELGLTAPRISIELAMGKRRERLVIGGSAPTPPGAAYAEVEGRGVFVITKQLEAALTVPAERFRSRTFVPYLSTDLSGIHLDGEGGPRHLARAAWGGGRGGGFRFDGSTPEGTVRVNAQALDRVLTALGRTQAEAFPSDAEAERAIQRRVTVTLIPRDPGAKRGVLSIGGACPAAAEAVPAGAPLAPGESGDRVVAIRREPTFAAACVPASVLPALTMEARELVDLSLIGAPLDEIAEVKSQGGSGGATLELARAESGWHLRTAVHIGGSGSGQAGPAPPTPDRAVPADIGQALVQAMLDVAATRVAAKPEGLDPPRSTLRVVSTPQDLGQGGDSVTPEREETLEIGAERGGVVHVRRLEDGAILEVPAPAAEALLPSALSLRPLEVFNFEGSRVRALRVEDGGRVQRLRRVEGGGWELIEPKGTGLGADLGLASDLADVLGRLKAARWIAAEAGGGGLGSPRLLVEATLDDGKTARVDIGAPTAGGSFARTGDGPAVFVAPAALEDAAGRLLLDRTVFLVSAEQIARATLAPASGGPLVVVAEPRGWTVTRRGERLDGAAAASLAASVRDALSGLIAEGAVSVGAAQASQGLDKPRLLVTIELPPPAQGAAPPQIRIAVGAGDSFHGTSVFYARRDGVDATYAIAQAKIRPLLEAAGVR